MREYISRLQTALGNVRVWQLYGAMAAYYLLITLLIPTPWFPGAPGFPFSVSIALGVVPLGIGLLRNTPASITTGFLMASIGPYNQTTVILAFALGVYLGFVTLWKYRSRLATLVREVFVVRGFYYLLAVTAYLMMVWLLRLGDSTDKWSFLALASSLLTVPFAAYSLAYLPWDANQVKNAVHHMFVLGLALATVVLVYPAVTGQYEQYTQAFFVVYKTLRVVVNMPMDVPWVDPDFNRAAFSSSHYLAAWMMIFAFGAVVAALLRQHRRASIGAAVVAVYCFALGENAHILPGVFAGGVAVAAFALPRRISSKFAGGMILGCAAVVLTLVVALLYFNGGRYALSQKASMYHSAMERIANHPFRMLLGDGPASYASRAANKRLHEGAIDIEYSFPFAIPDYSQPAFRSAVVKAKLQEGGSTMKRTLSGTVGLVMEWGILGTLLVGFIFYLVVRTSVETYRKGREPEARIAGAAAIFGLVLLVVSLSVRTYFEYAELSAFVSVLVMLANVSNPEAQTHKQLT